MIDTPVMLRAIRWRDWRYLAQLSFDAFPDATPAQVSRTLRDAPNIIVLEIADKPAGYAAFRHERQGVLWCDWMTVDPQYRSQGYGALLVQAVESVAAVRGYKTIMLAVLKANHRAYRFHCGHGYEVAGENSRKYHLMKAISGPVQRVPSIPEVHGPRIVRLWHRVLYGLLVGAPQRLRRMLRD